MQTWSNWSGSVTCAPHSIEKPSSEEQLIQLVREGDQNIRVAGTGHSFVPLCSTDGLLVSLDNLQGIVETQTQSLQATLWAGTKIAHIGAPLLAAGLMMRNQGDVDTQALAGAIATGTHGTGPTLGSISTQVAALRLILATGEILTCSETVERDIFKAAQVSLGLLGIISQVTLHVESAYRLHERTWIASVDECFAQLPTLIQAHRHCEFFWLPRYDQCVMKTLSLTDKEPEDIPIVQNSQSAAPGTLERYTRPERIDWAYRIFPSERNVRFNEMEFAIPAEDGPACFQEIRHLMQTRHSDVYWAVEYRTQAADDIYLSPAHKRATVAISVHQAYDLPYQAFFSDVETIFRNHHGRPHWGKIHSYSARELQALYPAWQQFQEVRQRLDPAGRFMNDYTKRLLLD